MNSSFVEEAKVLLSTKGYKLTRPRLVILDYMVRESGHLSVQEIYKGICFNYNGIGIATVYRTVDLLVEIGFLRALVLLNNQLRYELNRPGDHHHHLVCKVCGEIVEFSSCNFNTISEEIEEATRFKIEEHNLEAYGYCPDCLSKSADYSTENM